MNQQHAAFVEALGGPAKVIEKLMAYTGVAPACQDIVRGWKKKGIYWHWRYSLARIAWAEGIELPPGFLGPKDGRR